jgi:2-keto-4-pentenoate hydratase/2-oxohepta-3-ene-1,7-dioic acid hydratase in catechol pathway
MVTHLVRYVATSGADPGQPRWGVVHGASIAPLERTYATTGDLVTQGEDDWRARAEEAGTVPVGSVEVLSPVTTPCRVMCQGVNYREHAVESGMDPDALDYNLFFDKTDASVTGPTAPVVRPAHVQLLDHEIELALVVRGHVSEDTVVTAENLADHVFGVTIANDLSARDVQLPQGQFLKGKSYRGFCPVGPYLAVLERDEMGLIDELDLRLEVDGVVRQQDSSANLLHKPAETLTELSTFCDLAPGDLLLTGTPSGITASSPPALVRRLATALLSEQQLWRAFVKRQLGRPYLQPGQVVTASITHPDGLVDLGTQRTTIVGPPTS